MSDSIPTRLKTSAVRAIQRFEDEYYNDDGINAVEKTLEKKRDGLAQRIYKLAKAARKEADDLGETIVLFRAACDYAEERYKEDHEIVNIAKRIPAWPQFKSRIVRAMKNGIDPDNYESERMMREALQEKLTAPPTDKRDRNELAGAVGRSQVSTSDVLTSHARGREHPTGQAQRGSRDSTQGSRRAAGDGRPATSAG